MTEILQALGMGAALLLPIMVLVVLASIPAVRRGEAAAHGGELAHDAGHAGQASARRGIPFVPAREPSVLEILILGAVLFTLVMGGLLFLSLLGQMS